MIHEDSKVQVIADKYGNVINICNNPEYGYIRVEQYTTLSPTKSWLGRKLVKAIIMGTITELMALNLNAGQELPGKIVIKESHEPFDSENPDRDLKYAGDTGIPCHVYGEPIYRRAFYTENMSDDHVLIKHSNTDEIREALKSGQNLPRPGKWQKEGSF
jgi:hypothetical protein